MERVLKKIEGEISSWKDKHYKVKDKIEPNKKFVIFSTPRTGSTALCNSLSNNGFGDIREYFNGLVLRNYSLSLSGKPMRFPDYVQVAFSQGISSEGIFGMNILIDQFISLIKQKVNAFEMRFDKIYTLERRNKLKQAYSLMKSEKTFIFTPDILEEATKKYGVIEIDPDEVHFSICLSKILKEEAYMKSALKGLPHAKLYFEDIIADNFEGAVKCIRNDLGLSLETYVPKSPSVMSSDSDRYVYRNILKKIGLVG